MAKLRIEQGGETEEFQEQTFTADRQENGWTYSVPV